MKVCKSILFALLVSILVVSPSVVADDSSVEANIAFYSNVWDEIINNGRLDMISEANFLPDVVIHASPEDVVGIDATRSFYANYINGFSDIEFTINDIFGQGDKLVKWWTFKGTHTGDFFGIAPTGRAVVLDGATLVRMEDGRIAEERDFFDNHAFLQQLGLMSEE